MTDAPPGPSPAPSPPPARPSLAAEGDRLARRLAAAGAAARARERGSADDDAALLAAAEGDGAGAGDGWRLRRALALAEREGLPRTAAALRSARRGMLLAWVAVSAAAGASTALGALAGGADRPGWTGVNVLWVLGAILGLHTLFLALSLAWTARGLLSRGRAPHEAAAARLAERLLAGRRAPGAAVRGMLGELHAGRRGTLASAAASHAGGLAFAAGALLAVLAATAFREHYVYFWKTSLLSERQAETVFGVLAAPAEALGLPGPSPEQIREARWDPGDAASVPAQDAGEQQRWSLFLAGCVLGWAVLPRAVLLGAALAGLAAVDRLRRAEDALPPGYVEDLDERLAAARRRRADAARAAAEAAARGEETSPAADLAAGKPAGPPAVLRYEVEAPPEGPWPPEPLRACRDLGGVDGYADRERVLAELDAWAERPSALVAVFSRGQTPAAGERKFLRSLVERAGEGAAVVLTLGRSTEVTEAGASERIRRRTEQWRRAAAEAGVRAERVVEIDLEHLTGATAAALSRLVEGAPGPRSDAPERPTPTLAKAAERIAEAFDRAGAEGPDDRELAELFRDLAGLYRDESAGRWSARSLDEARRAVGSRVQAIARAAPAWLPRHAGWMTAAALAATGATLGGALALAGPAGLAAIGGMWPLYTAAGAALGEALGRGADRVGAGRAEPKPDPAAADKLRAAGLHAAILDLQGLPDAEIALALDRALTGLPEPFADGGDARGWLGELRSRLREACAAARGGEGSRA